jgi:hypothetical protein
MKKNYILLMVMLCLVLPGMGQIPRIFNYQGIARLADGSPMSNQNLHIKIAILPELNATESVFEEKHQVTTNAYGLYTLSIGGGQAIKGSMNQVAWEKGNQFVKVSIDLKGDGQFQELGTTQLLSVPYALYAEKAGNAGGSRAGNQHYLSKFDVSGSSSSEINSQLYDNGTQIGIGTTSPVAKFHISQSSASVLEHFRMQNMSANGAGRFTLYNNGASSYATFTKYGTTYAGNYGGSSLYPIANLLAFGNNGISAGDGLGRFLISSGGSIGLSLFKSGASKIKFHADYSTEYVGIGGGAAPKANVHFNSDLFGDTLKISDAVTGHGVDDGLDIRTTGGSAEIMNREINSLSLGTSNTKRLLIDNLGKVSINNSVPMMRFHVTDSVGQHLLLENNLALNTSQTTDLFFRQGNYYTGALKTIGTSASSARLGLFAGSQNSPGLIPERLTICNSGLVGIGDTTPTYTLDVNGSGRFTNGLIVESNTYSYGTIYGYADAFIDGLLDVDANIEAGADVNVVGQVTVSSGQGIVKSNSSTQLRMGFSSGAFALNSVAAGSSFDITFAITPFSGNNTNVRVNVCQFIPDAGSGNGYKQFIFTVDSVNDAANQCTIAVTNVGSTAASIDGTLYLMTVATD